MFSSTENLRIAMAASSLSLEDIIKEIETGIKEFRESRKETRLATSTMLFHIKLGMIKKFKTEDPFKTFEELEKLRHSQEIFKTNPQ